MRHVRRAIFLFAAALLFPGRPLAATSAGDGPDPALYVAPDGDPQGACGAGAPCTLERARALLRGRPRPLTAAVHVYLRGGTYRLAAPFVLGPADSGSPGAPVVYAAAPGERPVLSGGLPIVGPWERLEGPGGIYRAPVPAGLDTRQVFVDGRRQQRARGPRRPAGIVQHGSGYCAPAAMLGWGHPREVELVFYSNWQIHRCLVHTLGPIGPPAPPDGLDPPGTDGPPACPDGRVHATVDPACVTRAGPHRLSRVEWIENAFELLDEEGEFYLDPPTAGGPRHLYLKPADGRDPALSQVVAAAADRLLRIEGGANDPVHDVEIRGLTFAEATWRWPVPREGYSPAQAGVLNGGPRMDGAVSVRYAAGIRFADCTFTRLGGAGLTFDLGAQDGVVDGCRFDDLSGAALAVGDVGEAYRMPANAADAVRGHAVRNSYLAHTGVEYPDTPALFVGYAGGLVIEKNEIFAAPYSGISLGWGWGFPYGDSPVSRDNLIRRNEIHHTMRILEDGGGVYTLGRQPGSVIRDNFLHDQGGKIAGIYLDNGTQLYTVYRNVIARSPFWGFINACCQQENPPPPPARNNIAFGNIAQGPGGFANHQGYDPAHCTNRVCQNTVTAGWAELGATVLRGAGLTGAYRALHPPNAAVGRPATASSSAGPGWQPGLANDGDMRTGWRPWPPEGIETDAPPLPYWQVDLGARREIREVEIVTEYEADVPDARRRFVVLAADEPTFASPAVLGGQGSAPLPWREIWSARLPAPVWARYVRVAKTAPGTLALADVRVLVLPDPTTPEDEENESDDPLPPVPCPEVACPD